MSSEPAPQPLVDALRASTSKLQKTKSILDARARELDALQARLDHERQELENLAARLDADRQAVGREREEVQVARKSVDTDLASVREEREKVTAENLRVQEIGQALAERERALREGESRLERLDQDIVGRMNESEAKFRAIADRDEELLKVQQHWLIVFETREKELQAIAEQMQARHKQSAQMHQSLDDLHNLFKAETARLAAQREELAAKERSLIEAQKYLLTVLEATESEPVEDISAAASREPEPLPPPETLQHPPAPEVPNPPESEVIRESDSRPGISRAEAIDRLARAVEASKRARDAGRNLGDIRNALKTAKSELDGGRYENAARIADEIVNELRMAPVAR